MFPVSVFLVYISCFIAVVRCFNLGVKGSTFSPDCVMARGEVPFPFVFERRGHGWGKTL